LFIPGRGYITVNIPLKYSQDSILLITDVSGKIIHKIQVHGQQEVNLILSGHKSGFYMVQLFDINTKNKLAAKKIIVE
jgi:hypothetical protein